MERRGKAVISAPPETPLRDIARLMAAHQIGAVPIVSDAGLLLGLVAERHLVGAFAAHGAGAADMRAADSMARDMPTTTPDTDIMTVANIMTNSRTRHLPVLAPNRALIGLVSIGDVVKYRIDNAEAVADDLRNYVARTDHAGVAQDHKT